MLRIAVIIGTRPEAIKMAPVIAALEASAEFEPVVVNSGQHRELIAPVIELFDISVDLNLEIMQPNQGLAELTARLLMKTDTACEKIKPALILGQGDTTTVMAAALISFYRHIPFGHVEAGLRTYNLQSPFPEEANRRLVAPLASLHFAPTETAAENLRGEGVAPASICVTGNTVIDALQMEVARQQLPAVREKVRGALADRAGGRIEEQPYVLVTGHRRENFGGGFEQICHALAVLAERFADHLFIYPVHLNPHVQGVVHEKLGRCGNIRLIDPLPYDLFVALLAGCRLVLTDSGGVQEEAPSLGKPVLVMRDTTERPEGMAAGTVKLVGPVAETIVANTSTLLEDERAYRQMAEAVNPYGDGQAAARIMSALREFFDRGERESAARVGS